ncbi:conjugative transposon protein TraM [Christiangramia sp.]|uniref:conjugative transposon protein TraM n=1 Tax=Christiangramia sp. TaxID=1931228 RepID=UPI002617525F|nr:conjugative transposon protein TraM [Christiangramia sp.]
MMNLDKKKFVFGIVVLLIITFIGIYGFMLFSEDSEETETLEQPKVPLLEESQKDYESRKEAVDNLKETRSGIAPSIYDEKLIDKDGLYDPYLEEKEKIKLMDSILASGPEPEDYHLESFKSILEKDTVKTPLVVISPKDPVFSIGHGHRSFFLASQQKNVQQSPTGKLLIRAEVNGNQVVRKDQRLELRFTEDFIHESDTLTKNSIIYANCSFKANRLLLNIHPTEDLKTALKAYDISDGQEGIYIENSFRSQATTEVIDDLIQDINISGVPQVSGLKSIFQRSNRNVKVKVLHQYQLYLKPVL